MMYYDVVRGLDMNAQMTCDEGLEFYTAIVEEEQHKCPTLGFRKST